MTIRLRRKFIMKTRHKLLIEVVLSSLSISCGSVMSTGPDTNTSTQMEQPSPLRTPRVELNNDVLNKDYSVAEPALERAISNKDYQTMRLAMGSSLLPIKQKVVEAIGHSHDKSFVPDLIATLRNNQSVMVGGTEIQLEQDALNLAVIHDLEILTKLKFGISHDPSSKDIETVISKAKDWLAKNSAKEVH